MAGLTITDILNQWADFGIFAYVLPFLMIFAIVFGILNKTAVLGENRGVQAVIALAFGLLSLQFDYVANFFADIFPYAGIGIAVLLVALILGGIVYGEDKKYGNWIFFGIGALVFIIVLLTSLSDLWWLGAKGFYWAESWPAILSLIVIIAAVVLIISFSDKNGSSSGSGSGSG